MRKLILIAFILLFSLNISAQEKKVYVQKVTTTDKFFSGTIGDNIPVTIYLKFANLSGGDRDIYSVQGWYYYNKYKKKIPLVGIYDGNLTLYVFNNKDMSKKVIEFEWEDYSGTFWDYVESYKNLNNFTEKLTYSIDTEKVKNNEWADGSKKLSLNLYLSNYKDLRILNTTEYLKLPDSENFINLYDYTYNRNFEVVNYLVKNSEIKVLLKYDYTLRAYALGMCGAGNETGYMILRFDSSKILQEIKDIPLESCERMFYYNLKNSGNSIEVYNLESNSDSTDLLKNITIDLENITVKEE